MALLAGVLKSLISKNPATLFLNNVVLKTSTATRDHSHSTYSAKPIIPPKPQQPEKEYDRSYLIQKDALNGWTDWRMKKDHRRRQTVIRWGCDRKLVMTIKKNDILPREIREVADKELDVMPRDSMHSRLVWRCAISSRPRGTVKGWRLSRHFFRHLADYNKLSGIQRGIW